MRREERKERMLGEFGSWSVKVAGRWRMVENGGEARGEQRPGQRTYLYGWDS